MKYTELLDNEGKKLPKAWVKTMDKLVKARLLNKEQADGNGKAFEHRNPFTGRPVSLGLLASDLASWILSPSPYDLDGLTRQDWDNARYIFNVCWPKEYYELID